MLGFERFLTQFKPAGLPLVGRVELNLEILSPILFAVSLVLT